MKTQQIAKIAYEALEAMTQVCEGHSFTSWEDAPGEDIMFMMNLVLFCIDNPDATASIVHEDWLENRKAEGWTYGAEINIEKQIHEWIVPFHELSTWKQTQDYLVVQLVRSLTEQVKSDGESVKQEPS